MSLVDKLGERQSRKIFSPVDEVLLSEAAFSRYNVYLSFRSGRDSIFYSFLWGCQGGLLGGRVDLLG